jgi:hypothetical protein
MRIAAQFWAWIRQIAAFRIAADSKWGLAKEKQTAGPLAADA